MLYIRMRKYYFIILLASSMFSLIFFNSYINFKKYYRSNISTIVTEIKKSKSGYLIKPSGSNEYIDLYTGDSILIEKLLVNDSISKLENSKEIKIYRRKPQGWIYVDSLFISEQELFFRQVTN
jgi:hypothetical protein